VHRPRAERLTGRLVMAICLVVGTAGGAGAHLFRPGMLTLIERAPERYGVSWQRPSGAEAARLVHPTLPAACRATSDPVPYGNDMERWDVDCRPSGLRGGVIGADGLAGTGADVIVQIVWREARPFSAMLRFGEASVEVPEKVPDARTWVLAAFATYVRLGINHIWVGFDHLAFVTGLFLLAATPSILLWTITSFTLAHSLSLGLSIFNIVHLPSAPVEAVIALSVLLLAGELARGDTGTFTRRWPWLMAGSFGLVHGLGFAGALREVGIPEGRAAIALAGFNVGVEIGQLSFVACLAVLALVARPIARRWPDASALPTYAMGTAAAVWTIARVVAIAGGRPSAF
jgi:hypothetical protein